jgi:hypothetical protein
VVFQDLFHIALYSKFDINVNTGILFEVEIINRLLKKYLSHEKKSSSSAVDFFYNYTLL